MSETWAARFGRWVTPLVVLVMAGSVLLVISGNWNHFISGGQEQTTDDAYVRADVTPLSTKAAGLVAAVAVGDYQAVKAGDLLVRLRDEDFQAQVDQALAALQATEAALVNNQRQKALQDARIAQAQSNLAAAEADITAAEAGVAAANAVIVNARSGIVAVRADVERTQQERKRQEALFATASTTRQRQEQAVADAERFVAQMASRESDVHAAEAQLKSRGADLARAKARVQTAVTEIAAQKQQRSLLDSQEMMLRADVAAKHAAVSIARTNLSYTRIVAPEDGIVGERKVRIGQLVSPGTQVISLVQRGKWIQANFKENQLGRIREGSSAEVRIDAFPHLVLRGTVGQIAPASGSQFALLPPDNATGNFTKIAQRVPVKVLLSGGQQVPGDLRPGLSAVVTIDTRSVEARR